MSGMGPGEALRGPTARIRATFRPGCGRGVRNPGSPLHPVWLLCGRGPSFTLSGPSCPRPQEDEAAGVTSHYRGINSSISLGRVGRAGSGPSFLWLARRQADSSHCSPTRSPKPGSPSPRAFLDLIIVGRVAPWGQSRHWFWSEAPLPPPGRCRAAHHLRTDLPSPRPVPVMESWSLGAWDAVTGRTHARDGLSCGNPASRA